MLEFDDGPGSSLHVVRVLSPTRGLIELDVIVFSKMLLDNLD